MSDTYTLLLRSDAGHARPAAREGVVNHLTRIPGLAERGPDRWAFEDDGTELMQLDLFVRRDGARVEPREVRDDEADRCDEIEVRMPRAMVVEKGPRVFALVFMLAEWAKWEVFDPQIDDRLQKEAVLSGLVAMRQAQRDQEATRPAATTAAPPPPPEPAAPDEEYRPSTADPPPAPKERRRPWWKKITGG